MVVTCPVSLQEQQNLDIEDRMQEKAKPYLAGQDAMTHLSSCA